MLYTLAVLAQDPGGKEGGGGLFGNSFFILLPIILMLYLLIVVLPGRRRQEKERSSLLNKMEKGTKVVTIGGIYGTIISVESDKDELVLKVDDGTRLRMTKGSIARNITAEEAKKEPGTTSASNRSDNVTESPPK